MTWQEEAIALHQFFESWFNGTCDVSQLARLEDALTDGFSMIVPGGRLATRDRVVAAVRDGYGRDPGLRIQVDGFEELLATADVIVGRYVEHHIAPGEPETARISTAVFQLEEDGTPRWVSVHETWSGTA